MKALLDGLLPRLFPEMVFQCVPHDGKGDLEKSIPRKLRGWREPGVRFVVVRDNDRGNCLDLKRHLRDLCADRPERDFLIRIACQELEAWYLGQPDALAEAFDKESLRRIGGPGAVSQPRRHRLSGQRVDEAGPADQKVSGARALAVHLTREGNRSPSFHAMIDGIERLASQPYTTHQH